MYKRYRNFAPAERLEFFRESQTGNSVYGGEDATETPIYSIVAEIKRYTALGQFAAQFSGGEVAHLEKPRWRATFRPSSDKAKMVLANDLVRWRGDEYRVIAVQMTETAEFVQVTFRSEGS